MRRGRAARQVFFGLVPLGTHGDRKVVGIDAPMETIDRPLPTESTGAHKIAVKRSELFGDGVRLCGGMMLPVRSYLIRFTH